MLTTSQLRDLEEEWPRRSGRKDEAIRAHLGISPARDFQLLHRALDDPAALAERPMFVRRLIRRRDIAAREQQRRAG